MTIPLASGSSSSANSACLEAAFGISADGFPVARVGDNAFAMLPGRDGRHYLASGWRIRRPLAEWRRDDFYGHSGELADEAAFRARVLEHAEHQRERQALGRHEISSRVHTPWGTSQGATVYAEGVEYHSTAGSFYEEDCAWAIVALTFPHLFTGFERRCAERTIKDNWFEAWEAIAGTILAPGESHEKARRAFEAEHAGDWIVVSAITSEQQPEFVECIAAPGGHRGPGTEERRFLVPSDDYTLGRFGFVIDPDCHAVYDGPSSFIGWQGRTAT